MFKQTLGLVILNLVISQNIFAGCNNAQKNANPYSGQGTLLNPYKICTVTQFNNIANNSAHFNKHFSLEENLDFTGKTLNEIGSEANPFKGKFNGKNNRLSNIVFTFPTTDVGGHGIFRVTNGATIYNLNINKPYMEPSTNEQGVGFGWQLGILVGHAISTHINDVNVTNAVMPGRDYTGILVGHLENSYVTSSETSGWIANTGTADGVGGLVGVAMGSFIVCNKSNVKIDYMYDVQNQRGVSWGVSCNGGLVGAALESTIYSAQTSGYIKFPMDQNGNYLPQDNSSAKGFGKIIGCTDDNCHSHFSSNLILKVDNAQYQGGNIGWIMQ